MIMERATLADVAALTKLSKAAFDTDSDVGSAEPGGPPEYDREPWHTDMCRKGCLYRFTDGGELIGGALLFRDAKSENTLYIGRIFIDPRLYRRGYGLEMMQLIEGFFAGVTDYRLETPVWNTRTNRFYPKAGYAEVARDAESVYYQKTKQ